MGLILEDCVRLYNQLDEDSKIEIVTEHIRLRDLHDWMAKKHRRQTHQNIILDVPEHIINRFIDAER